MKKMFLMGRSEAGKTSLTQILHGEELHYHKTQYTNTDDFIIDSPGEYSETKHCGIGLACFSFEADVLALVMAADEPFAVFEPNCNCWTNRPLIGIITAKRLMQCCYFGRVMCIIIIYRREAYIS